MILALDAGNTYIIMGLVREDHEVIRTFQLSTNTKMTAYEYAVSMKQIMELEEVRTDSFEGAIISSVVPPLTVVLEKAVRMITGHVPLIVGAGVKTGLNIRLDDPGTIAGDLVSLAVAAREYYPLPCIVVDMGTATTITVVDASGSYIGGSILPGAELSMKALAAGTSLLPDIDFQPPKKVIGTNTVDAMRSGLIFGHAGAVDGIIDRYRKELGETGSIVATGGAARLIAPFCRNEMTVDNRLLLKGLGIIYDRTMKAQKKSTAGKNRSAHNNH